MHNYGKGFCIKNTVDQAEVYIYKQGQSNIQQSKNVSVASQWADP